MNKLSWPCLVFLIMASGCATSFKQDPLKKLAIEECADVRQSSSEFNRHKSARLVRYECGQLITLDESYRKIENRRFVKSRRQTYGNEQEYFDDQTWFLVIERIRQIYYPSLLPPEEEITRADQLNDVEFKNNIDKSLLRVVEPRLLSVSPYLMTFKELDWADEAADKIAFENKGNKRLRAQLSIISRIIHQERQKKDPFKNRY